MLAEVVADIKQDWDWKETLDLSTELSLADTALEHDDLKRETLLLVLACLLIILCTWHVARHTIITTFSNHRAGFAVVFAYSYNLATEASNRGYGQLRREKIPFERPADFYAEMLKSDSHMQKIKDRLIFQRQKLAAFESRKKACPA